MKSVVLAGGLTNRMLPLTENYPRALLSLMGKPLFMHSLTRALRATAGEGIVVVSSDVPVGEVLRHLQSSGIAADVTVKVQRNMGIEGALLAAGESLEGDDWFMLVYGDVITEEEAFRLLLDVHRGSGRPSALVIPSPEVRTYGVARVEGNMVSGFFEKPDVETSYVVGGAFVLPYEILSLMESGARFTEALNHLVERVGVHAAFWPGRWVAVDYPWDLISALYNLMNSDCGITIARSARVAPTAVLEGCVVVDEGAVVDHFAVIKGPVYIGRNSFVGVGAFVREYSSIEEGAVVGAYSEVKRSILQPYSTVGSFSLVTDSVLGYKSVAEPRTTVVSMLAEGHTTVRELPLQGIVKKSRKLGVFLSPHARVKAGSVVGPAMKIYSDGRVESA